MAKTEFSAALNQVSTERNIPVEVVLASIEAALVSAYKRDFGASDDLVAKVDPETGEARIIKGEEDVTPSGFGRIAAQTAKQVILQKIRESEKEVIMTDFQKKVGTIINGHIFRIEKGLVIVDLGKAQGIIPQSEQVSTERYRLNQKIKVLVKDIRDGSRGLEIILSRADAQFVVRLFEMEVPEVATGVVRIESITREAGSRTKMAVSSRDSNVDPVGSCVGQKGVRVQAIISELGGEKIDIVQYNPEPDRFIALSLSPAKVMDVILDTDTKEAKVIVPDDQQSLAIGKEGQNVRLAAKLTGWKIDIKGLSSPASSEETPSEAGVAETAVKEENTTEAQATKDNDQVVESETSNE